MNPQTCYQCKCLERDKQKQPVVSIACGIQGVTCVRTKTGVFIEENLAKTQAICVEEGD